VPELWQRFKEECEEMLVAGLYLANLLIQQSFVWLTVSVAGVAEGDAQSILFEPIGRRERIAYSCFLAQELHMCNVPTDGMLEEKRESLQSNAFIRAQS